ncbi:SDR family NAD(P)-dependent oxidoreductase [Peristeroidobacter soli]|jgi:3-hydroxybutyrate dehydrogenase|uniref:SDR family NAD(P)-dependent oxidoreductase n=1 Tax=Peristeroidobacter soli TaxID=2497877 RepID=UPI00101CCE2B|nr:SDR family oxidoreductase [Peristeroidobacter soli]
MSHDFKGKRVLVTGGSRGIGLSVADAFLAAGAEVVVLAESEEVHASARALSDKHRRPVGALLCDITNRKRLRAALSELGSLDVLVANAGTGDITSLSGPEDEIDDLFERIIRINLIGAFNTVRASLPLLRAGSRIIFTTSVHGQSIAPPNMSGYAASKGGLEAMMRSFARELGPSGINVNAVAPGMVTTELTLGAIRKLFSAQIGSGAEVNEADMIKQLNTSQAIHFTPIDPARLAQAYLFLASPAGAEITGQSLNVDHGMAMK